MELLKLPNHISVRLWALGVTHVHSWGDLLYMNGESYLVHYGDHLNCVRDEIKQFMQDNGYSGIYEVEYAHNEELIQLSERVSNLEDTVNILISQLKDKYL